MATSRDYSQSVLAASDELKEIYCEPCQEDGKTVVSDGYCVDCPEYLCAQCVTSHKRHKALAKHKILDKASMPLSSKHTWTVPDVYEEKCSPHQDKVIEYFCEKCDTIGCSACMTLNHRQCDDVKLIIDKAKDIRTGENFNKFTEKMKNLGEHIGKNEKKMDSNVAENNEMKSKAFEELANCRRQVDQFFDDLERQMRNEIVDIEQRNDKNMKEASTKIQAVRRNFDRIQNEMERKKGSDCALFITIKKAEKEVMQIKDKLNQIVDERRIQRYRLLPSSQIQDVMESVTEICTMLTAKFESKIDIRAENDKEKPNVRGLTTVHDHFYAVLDSYNKCVKIIETRTHTVTSSADICAKYVWGLTSISNEKIAVSLTSLDNIWRIQILPVSANGKIQCVAKTLDLGQYLSITDISCGKRAIFGISVTTVYSVSMAGVTYVYVSSWGTDCVWQLTLDLKKVQIITDSPCYKITYRMYKNNLLIINRNTIDVYFLSKTRKKIKCLPNVS